MSFIQSTAIPLMVENIDTDQIIPAAFLKATNKEGFGNNLFYNWRYENNQPNPNFVLNQDKYKGCILVAGNNFGCGSSREHAAWAIADYGFKAIISSQFADIFKGNALNNNILPIELKKEIVSTIANQIEQSPELEIEIDLERQLVIVPQLQLIEPFEINQFRKQCILEGIDETEYLINMREEIKEFAQNTAR